MRLHRALDGQGEPPAEWLISRVCEEFRCLPSVALRELEEHDADLVASVMALRSYAAAKQHVDSSPAKKELLMTPAIRQVFEIEIAIMAEDAQAHE